MQAAGARMRSKQGSGLLSLTLLRAFAPSSPLPPPAHRLHPLSTRFPA